MGAPASLAHGQAGLPVQPMNALVIGLEPLALEQDVQPPVAEATALAAQGKAAEAAQVMAEARRLNPQIDSFRQQFVAFAQD